MKQYPNTTPFNAKYSQGLNPEDEWIKSQTLFASPTNSQAAGKVGEKSAVELMQDMLRGVSYAESVNAYYSKQAQEKVGVLLTNEYKRNSYILSLQSQLGEVRPSVAKNYQLLMTLLREVSKNELVVNSSSNGLSITYNQKVLDNQQLLLDRLRREKQVREAEERRVIREYEAIIADLHRITEELARNEQKQQQ